MPEDPNPSASKEREFETGTDEYFKHASQNNANNMKRTYDAYQHAELAGINRGQTFFESAVAQLQANLAQVNQLTLQHIQNAIQLSHQATQNALVTTDNTAKNTSVTVDMTAKQAVKHADVAADALWNPVQQGSGDNLTAGSIPANRATDVAAAATGVAAAGQAVNAEAVATATAIAVNASLTPLFGALQTIVSSLASMNTQLASVVAQVQPKEANVSK